MPTDKDVMIGALHTIFAYPDRAAEMLAAMEKACPDGVAFLEAWAAGEYDAAREKAIAAVPVEIGALERVGWAEVGKTQLAECGIVAAEGEPIKEAIQ
jgi:hypothetical protein